MSASSVEKLIIELFNDHPSQDAHFTAAEVFNHLKPQLPAVNPSTIYRALERMAHAGKISVSDMGTGSAVYEMVGRERHHHLVCQECGKILTIGDKAVACLFEKLHNENNFEILTNHLILFGTCQECRQKKNRTNEINGRKAFKEKWNG